MLELSREVSGRLFLRVSKERVNMDRETMRTIQKILSIKVTDHAATGDALRQRRLKAGISLREMARRLGLSAPYLCDLEYGRRTWTQERVDDYLGKLTAG